MFMLSISKCNVDSSSRSVEAPKGFLVHTHTQNRVYITLGHSAWRISRAMPINVLKHLNTTEANDTSTAMPAMGMLPVFVATI